MNVQNYTVTNDSVTVIADGRPVVVKRGAPNFVALRKALLEERWADVPAHLRTGTSLERWARGKFRVEGDRILFDGKELPTDIGGRISEMAANGEDPTPLLKFWERLQANPSYRSVEQLWRFLNNVGIPLTSDGHFLAYKSVREDYRDVHSNTIVNRPGETVEMARNRISDDPNTPCHVGLHVGALEYASSFGGSRIVVCKVDPADVVCVPYDYSSQKMRVCRYEVVGQHATGSTGHMPSTSIPDAQVPPRAKAVTKGKKRNRGFAKLDAMDEAGLMQVTVEALRAYASKGLQIVGASRIPGGKWALVQAIMGVRE